MFWFVTS